MARRGLFGLAAIGAVGALALAACSSSSTPAPPPSGFNKAVTSVVNPSNAKGGTITFDNSSAPDSTDAGNTYYAFNLNFTRLYATPLTTYKSWSPSPSASKNNAPISSSYFWPSTGAFEVKR